MEFIESFLVWIESREGLLSGLAALVVVTGVFLSPVGKLINGLFSSNKADASTAVSPPATELSERPRPKPDGTSMIVLPFQTISTDPADGVLADAIHEDLTTQLARMPNYFVLSRTTALTYRNKTVPVEELHDELGVAYALEGSVRRANDHLRITAQLIDTRTGGHIWADNFDRPAAELMSLQNDLIAEIVTHLGSELNLAEVRTLWARSKVNPTALDEYKRAQSVLHRTGWNKKGLADTIEALEKALKVDPDFAPAISHLALMKGIATVYGFLEDADGHVTKEVVELAQRAVSLDNQSTDVLGFSGCALCDVGRVDEGLVHLQRAIEIDPSNAQAHAAYGFALILQGRPEEGVPLMEAAIRISPKAPGIAFWLYGLSMGLETLGRTEQVRERLEHAIRADPKFPASYPFLAGVAVREGDEVRARDLMAQGRRVEPDLNETGIRTIVPESVFGPLKEAGLVSM